MLTRIKMERERVIAWRELKETTPVFEGNDLLHYVNDAANLYPFDKEGYANIELRFAAGRIYNNFIACCRPEPGYFRHWPEYINDVLNLSFFSEGQGSFMQTIFF